MKVRAIRCEIFSRVVGYYRPVESWNEGKKEEFRDRAAAGTALDRLEAEVAPPVFGV